MGLIIKVPIYTSEEKPLKSADLFPGANLAQLVEAFSSRIKMFMQTGGKISIEYEGKTLTSAIYEIACESHLYKDRPYLLVRFNYYDTNIHDGFIKKAEVIQLDSTDKVDRNNYYFILYPIIDGIDPMT